MKRSTCGVVLLGVLRGVFFDFGVFNNGVFLFGVLHGVLNDLFPLKGDNGTLEVLFSLFLFQRGVVTLVSGALILSRQSSTEDSN